MYAFLNRAPYGNAGWANLVVNFLALLFFMFAAFRCFFSVNKTDDYKIFVGYWGAENLDIASSAGRGNDNNYCVGWNKDTKKQFFDGAWRFGRFLGVMGALISIPLFLFAFYILVYRVDPKVFTGLLAAYISMAIMTLLLLVGLSSDLCDAFDCSIGPGGFLAIFDSILWMVAACLAVKMKGAREDEAYDDDQSEEKPSPDEPLPALPPSTTKQDALSNKV